MIQKLEKGKGFRGAALYVLEKGDAKIIGGTMAGTTPRELSREAGEIRKLNPNLGRAVFHASLSLARGESLTDEKWAELADRYMQKMGFGRAPYFVARHNDTEHEHIHIVAIRIDTETGKTISDSQDYKRGEAIVRELEKEFGLQPPQPDPVGRRAPTRGEIRMMEKTGQPSVKLKLQAIIDEAIDDGLSMPEFLERLRAAGVGVVLNMAKTGRISGISFDLDGHAFKGSKLGKGYSWAGLQKRGISYEQNRDLEKCRAYSNRATAPGGEIDSGSAAQVGGTDRADRGIAEVAERREQRDSESVTESIREHDRACKDQDRASNGRGAAHRELARDGTARREESDSADRTAVPAATVAGAGGGGADRLSDWTAVADLAGDLAAEVAASGVAGGASAGDGAGTVKAHIRKKCELWRRQADALDAPAYRITLMPRRDGLPPINLGKGKSKKRDRERFWTADEVADKIPLLSAKNANGYDIYITPIDPDFHYLVLDDSTQDAIEELKRAGAKPALVQESSPGNVQAVFRVPRQSDRKDEQSVANRVVQALNQKYGDPRFTGVIHPFRLAGFGNAKPNKQLEGGRRFFTQIIDAQGGVCPLLTRRLEIERQRADEAARAARQAEAAQEHAQKPKPAKPGVSPAHAKNTLSGGDMDAWRVERWRQRRLAERLVAAGKWQTIDESAIDYRTARALLQRGLDDDEIRRLMASDPSVQERHGRALDDYCLRTVSRAKADVERQAKRSRYTPRL